MRHLNMSCSNKGWQKCQISDCRIKMSTNDFDETVKINRTIIIFVNYDIYSNILTANF